eukprot:CAMPEP_0194279456 /NCGR_PEP_ID=MMETSP0169-20130528/13938_1 /TAXON_ID=218684 /ORGANISM="Corethron pennatum, Strain L29A3" /LENGTH=80 /DNA_ID=CAMNT_0039023879 /DNA_START=72 /DNA_END=314 /DNA_ORIENTATION=+
MVASSTSVMAATPACCDIPQGQLVIWPWRVVTARAYGAGHARYPSRYPVIAYDLEKPLTVSVLWNISGDIEAKARCSAPS